MAKISAQILGTFFLLVGAVPAHQRRKGPPFPGLRIRRELRETSDGRRVSNATLANAASVLNSNNWKNIQDGGATSTNKSKIHGPVFSPCCRAGIQRRKKTYTTTTERESFGEPFSPQRRTFQAGGRYKNPIKTKQTVSTTEIFPLWPPILAGKERFLTGAGRCMLSFSQE